MKRRLLIIVLALILAGIGTSGVLAYVKGANARAIAGLKAVSVLVAQKTIPSGTTASTALRSGMLASEKLPASSVSAEALSSIPASLFAKVLSADLQPGQVLLRQMLVTPAQVTSGLAIPPGMMALTITFCLPEAVAGAVQAGSQIAVFDTVGSSASGPLSAVPGCTGSHVQISGAARTRVVLQRVTVLSVGTASPGASQAGATATSALSGSSSSGSSQTGTLVTVAVTQADAERLIQMTETGMPYLALLTTSSRTTADAGNLLSIVPRSVSQPSPAITLPLITPSVAPTTPAPPSAPTPSPTPSPSQTHHGK